MSAAVYARCTEPTPYLCGLDDVPTGVREGCGWTVEVKKVERDELLDAIIRAEMMRGPEGTRITHDGEGRWPFDIDKCPSCGGTIEVDK